MGKYLLWLILYILFAIDYFFNFSMKSMAFWGVLGIFQCLQELIQLNEKFKDIDK